VADFMRHDARQFGFVICFQNQPGVHEEEPSRKRERVDLGILNNLDGEGNLGI